MSCHGQSGQPYRELKKGTTPYNNGMAQVASAKAMADLADQAYQVRAVTVVHGESDHVEGSTHYGLDLATWQANYEADIAALTLQHRSIPMLHSQMSSWTMYGSAVSTIPQQQLAASIASGGKIQLVGPKYNLPYADGVHLTNHGYRQLGEYFAKAYRSAIVDDEPWEPLRPSTVTRRGAKISIRFLVPVPPLVFDTTLVDDPGNFGFEFVTTQRDPPAILTVTLTGPDNVEITLTAEPTGSGMHIQYAFSGDPMAPAGPKTGPRGNLRDSDATPSLHGYPLFNWAVHFSEPVS